MTDKYDERAAIITAHANGTITCLMRQGSGIYPLDELQAWIAAELRAVAAETRGECAKEVEEHTLLWRGPTVEEPLTSSVIPTLAAAIRAKK